MSTDLCLVAAENSDLRRPLNGGEADDHLADRRYDRASGGGVAVPLVSGATGRYIRLDMVVPIRPQGPGPRRDVVIVVGKPRSDSDIIALEYARQAGAVAIRLAAESTAPSLFAADLVFPERG